MSRTLDLNFLALFLCNLMLECVSEKRAVQEYISLLHRFTFPSLLQPDISTNFVIFCITWPE